MALRREAFARPVIFRFALIGVVVSILDVLAAMLLPGSWWECRKCGGRFFLSSLVTELHF